MTYNTDIKKRFIPITILKRMTLLFSILFISLSSIAFADTTRLPAISISAGHQQTGSFLWFDLVTSDRAKVRTYYEKLFGWKISKAAGEDDYDLISNKGTLIGGIADIEKEEQAVWLGSLSVPNVPKAVSKVKQLGGKVLEPAQKVDDRGVVAIVEDNMGAVFVLLDTGSRDPVSRSTRPGDWLWTDLFTTDIKKSSKFYKELVGLKHKRVTNKKKKHIDLLAVNGKIKSGMVKIPWKHVTPTWLPYIRVKDLTSTMKRSIQLGGKVFHKFKGGAILLDPTGAAFGIQQIKGK